MRILLIEDDATVAQTVETLLASHRYAVDIAADGLEGLAMVEAYTYDLILLDIGLPQLDGISLCQQLRAQAVPTPIMLLTGQATAAHGKAIALNAGADDYVTKPFDAEELLARVQSLLRRGDLKTPPILQWGALRLDPSRLLVSYGETLLHPTPKEYSLLELLLRQAPSVVSSSTILEQCWSALDVPTDEGLRTHLKEIRKKLKVAGAPADFIKTVHRQGYRLNPLYGAAAFSVPDESTATVQMAELKAVNEELRQTLEQLQATQAELQQRNQDLQAARDELAQQVAARTAALSQQEAFFSSIYEGTEQPIFVVAVTATGDFRYLSHNRAAQKAIGMTLEAVQDKTPEEVFGPESGAQFRQDYERCVQAEHSVICENQFVFQGYPIWTLTTLSPLRDATGRIDRLVGMVVDITDRKRLETDLETDLEALELLHSLSTRGVPNGDLQALYDEILATAIQLMKADGGTVQILDQATQELRLLATTGFERSMMAQFAHINAHSHTPCGLALATGQRTFVEFDVPASADPDGSLRRHREAGYCSAQSTPLISRLGQPLGMVSTHWCHPHQPSDRELRLLDLLARQAADLIEQQQIHPTLHPSEKHYHYLVELTRQLVWHADAQGHTYISPQLSEYTGLLPEELLDFDWQRVVHPDDADRIHHLWQAALQTGTPYEAEYRLRRADGAYRWHLVRAIPIPNDLEMQWFGVSTDIHDRKQLELSCRASEAKLNQIVNSAIAAIASFRIWRNREWTYDYFSAGCEAVFGYTAQELMSDQQLWWSRVWPADRDRVLRPLIDELLAERDVTVEFQFRHKDGSRRWIRSSHTSQRIDDDCWVVTVVNTDISDRKQAELALKWQIRQEYLLADIAQEIRQSLELDQVLYSTVGRVREWLECDRVTIFRFRPDWQGDVIMESVGAEWLAIQSTTIVDPCFVDHLIEPYRQGHVAVLHDIAQPDLEPCYVELLQQFQVKASLAVPLLQGNALWGLLIAHQCSGPRQWQPAEIAILRRLATQVGIAIQQSELYEQTRRELSARGEMQAFLEASEARFRSLSAAAPIGICQTDADGNCLYVNPRWCEISGLRFEDCLGNGWLQSVHPDDRDLLATAWARYLQDGGDSLPEFRILTPEGDIRWISARMAPIQSPTGETIGYVSTDEDITKRKRAEQARQDSEQRLQAILDHSPAAIYLLDHQHRYLLVNRSYADIFGTSQDDLMGQSLYAVWPPEQADIFATQNRNILETEQLLQIEETVPLANGIHHFLTVKFPLYDASGNPYAVCGISTDITAKKNLETQLYQAQRLESLGTLAGGIAHDLNNVFTPILAVAQMLQQSQIGLTAKGLEQLQLLEKSAHRGANLVKQILTVTRTSQGEQVPIDLAALLHEEVTLMRQSLPKTIEIVVDIPSSKAAQPALGKILADPTYLHQIVLNLCVNARDAMPEGGTLTISATTVFVDEAMAAQHLESQVGQYAVITVADTGTGIDPETQKRIFDPFFTTKAPGQGTGLGLTTVRGLVKANQGFLQVFSQMGQGSQFKVYFPLIEAEATQPEPPPPTAIATSDHHGKLVLVVEDEVDIGTMLQLFLEGEQYQVILAQDGAIALEHYRQRRSEIQLVITDIMMPNVSGISLIQDLKALNPAVKILAFSGVSTHEETVLAAGADAFLAKPFDLEILLRRITTLIHSADAT